MAQYECMFIINPSIGEKEIATTIELLKTTISKSGKIEKEEIMGDKKMAYKIKGSDRGYYGILHIDIDGTAIKGINQVLNLNGDIWRYMFVKIEA